jgi:hypothetical protein
MQISFKPQYIKYFDVIGVFNIVHETKDIP